MKKIFIPLLVLLFATLYAEAQSEKALKKQAKQMLKYKEYHDALELYLKLDSISPNNPEYNLKIGICYLHSSYNRKALPYLETAYKLGAKDKNLEFYMGRAYHLHHRFDEAMAHYAKAKHGVDMVKHDAKIKNMNRYQEMCRYGKELMQAPVQVKIENIGPIVNSEFPDFVPVVSADESVLIFTSRRPNTTGGLIEEATKQFHEDIYVSYKDKNGEWSEPRHIEGNINEDGHDATISLSADGQKLFIYKHINQGDIFVSDLVGDRWSEPQPLPEGINTKYYEPSASISPDEKILFFSSDRPGGYGGTDIYYSLKKPNGHWTEPVNCGRAVNTEFNDDAPFVHADGKTLYFSSQGHNCMGGYDIFTSTFTTKDMKFHAPVNLGYPINTADDDIFFVWSADGTRGYFSSFRQDSHGEKDIYVMTRPAPKVSLIVLKGKVFGKDDQLPVGTMIQVIDNETEEVISVFNSNSSSGKYIVLLEPGKNYGLYIEQPGFLPYSDNVYVPEKNEFYEVVKDMYLERLVVGSMSNLKNVFFDHDKATLRPESHIELDKVFKLIKDNPDMYFEVAGHTDSVGTNDYNHKLSQERAKAVVDYLIKKGIEASRLYPVGYGEDFFVAPNATPEGRQLNRRTELIVIKKPADAQGYDHTHGFYHSKMKQMK